MSNYKRELSNLSYTNKDFNQIYPELLDLAKKISYKWDPSVSDESDPGVVLLKLAALMADKCNYNIDKNVLELFPLSVTQLANARQLFDQCGYTMRYFQSATTSLSVHMIQEPDLTDDDVKDLFSDENLTANDVKKDTTGNYLRQYIVPRFTMFSDVDNSVVYTIVEDLNIPSNGDHVSVQAVQGVVNSYSVDGSEIITADMLDENNRLYFRDLNVPENGIFINNIDQSDYWIRSDNLMIEPVNKKCYKFGLALDGNRCYIEFPSDIDTLIGSGINIHYMLTAGVSGNVRRNFIRQMFTEIDITRRIATLSKSQSVKLTTDNIYIVNDTESLDGRNPETIDEAYRNYQKVKTTFNTLVSSRDYSNFLVTNKCASNCFVCDRSDDAQSSYSILTSMEGEPTLLPFIRDTEVKHKIDESDSTYTTLEPELTAFDLRVYGLKYVDGFSDYKNFSKSFELLRNGKYSLIETSTSDVKCLSHNYKDFVKDRIILLKNRYPIVARIVSPHKLAPSQQNEILNNVKLKLFQCLNSQMIEFGQEIDYNLVYNTILTADSRISAVVLDDIAYETYAVYLSSYSDLIEHIRIDSLSEPPVSSDPEKQAYLVELWKNFRTSVYTRSILSGHTPLFVPDSTFLYSIAHEKAIEDGNLVYSVKKLSSSVDIPLRSSFEGKGLTTGTLRENDVITLTAPNLIMDKRYANYCQFVTNIGCYDYVATDETVSTVKTLQSTRPEYNDPVSSPVVTKNTDYVLKEHEYIIFFWRTSDDKNEPYTYVKYTGRKNSSNDSPTIICPSFDMRKQPHTDNLSGVSYHINDAVFLSLGDYNGNFSDGIQLTVESNIMYEDGGNSIPLNDLISRYFVGSRFNVASNSIETKKINKIHLNNTDNGTTKFYWILNRITSDGKYQLFSQDEDDNEYILQDGEQLVYSNDRLTQLYVLGAGTKILRQKKQDCGNAVTTAWECPALEHTLEFLTEGPQYFENSEHPWFNMSVNAPKFDLYATEMIYRKMSTGTKLFVKPPEGDYTINKEYLITSDGIITADKDTDPEFQLFLCSYEIHNEVGEIDKLPDRSTPELNWKISSSLNMNMSYDSPQRLYSNQKLSWECFETDDIYSIVGSDVDEICVQSDRSINRTGGSNIDVTYYDVLTEEYHPLNIYVYKLKDPDLSTTLDTNNYDSPWRFYKDKLVVSGKDVRLTNVSLPQGDYVMPIQMTRITNKVDVFWTELRKLENYMLTDYEKEVISKLQMKSSTFNTDTDWHLARKPIQLADVAKWIYGSANVDVSREFSNKTVSSVFNELFIENEESGKFDRTNCNSDMDKMLLGFGGKYLSTQQSVTFENGDIVCIRRDKTNEVTESLEMGFSYEVWVYAENGMTSPFISVTSTSCSRKDLNDFNEVTSFEEENEYQSAYYFILRPSKITEKQSSDNVFESSINNVTDVVADKDGVYYYIFHSNGFNSTYTLRLCCSDTQKDQLSSIPAYTLSNPIKYTYPTLTAQSKEPLDILDRIIHELNILDRENLFNYAYDVPSEDLVSYPLDSISFLDVNHPMNKFTICQYVLNESSRRSDLVVSGRSR